MEAKKYLMLLRRWSWLLIIGLFIGGASAFAFSISQQPVYQAITRVLVMRAPESGTSDFTYLNDQQLAQTYTQTISTRPILDAVGKRLGAKVSNEQITASIVPNTQLIQISVEDTDAQRAADITNTLVNVFIEENNQLQASRFADSEQSLQAQINQIEDQITAFELRTTAASQGDITEAKARMDSLQQQIVVVKGDLVKLDPPTRPGFAGPTPSAEIQAQITAKELSLHQLEGMYDLYQQLYNNLVVLGNNGNLSSGGQGGTQQLQSTLALYQQIHANLLSSYENVRLSRLRSTSNIVPVDPAVTPSKPIRPQPIVNAVIGAVVGLLLAGGIAFMIEYLDDSIKNPEDVERILGVPVLGYIGEVTGGKAKSMMNIANQPRSPVAEAFRSLRTNLEFAGLNQPLHTILVTSPGPGDGKTTVSSNLASIFAQGGKHVTLIDADLRRPAVHRFFNLDNHIGLTDVFRGRLTLEAVGHSWNGTGELTVITTGSLPPNPTEILSSEKMANLLILLKEQRDVVIIDSPPSIVADAQVLAAKADGVIIVLWPGRSHWEEARAMLEQLKRAEARVVGVVFNRIPQNRSNYYGGYKHYSPYNKDKYHYYRDDYMAPDKTALKKK